MSKHVRLDSAESIFFARELEYIKAQSYDIKYAVTKIRSLLPVSFEAGPGADTIVYEQYDQVGIAKIVADYANDFPRSDVKGKEFKSSIRSLGASYGYSIQEIRSAAKAGKPLSMRKANAARKAVAILENRLAYQGDASRDIPGWLTNPNIPDVILPADGAGALTTFASKIGTPDLIIRDLNSIVNAVRTQSNDVENPNMLLMPLAQKTLIGSTPRSANSDTTILEYFLRNNQTNVSMVDSVIELAASNGIVANDTAIAYDRNPNAITLEIPSEFEVMDESLKGMEYEVPVHERFGGVIIYYPLSQAKCEDI